MSSHESALIRAFFKKEKQERYLFLFSHPGRRAKALSELHHFNDFDPRYINELASQADVESELRKKGAPETCYVISYYRELDGRDMPLVKALEECKHYDATILSCLPGKLAYYQGEDGNERLILGK